MLRRFKVSIWLGLMFVFLPLGLARAQTLTVDRKVDPKVLTDLQQDGKVTFFVVLREQMNASHAVAIGDRKIRGEAVVNSLKETAARTQAAIVDFLSGAKAEVTPYWIVNTIKVTTHDERLIQDLAAFPNVALIKADETWQIPEPLPGAQEPTIQGVEWGVARVRAPEVWTQFNVRGEGIVVANIDTGVQFNHPALVTQYRGLQSGGTFDHNYNWHDPSRICGNPSLIPCDNNSHGTHTMGTIVGDDRGANQIGVAPGAKWIAAKGCESNSCSLSALLSSGQWVLAPTELNGQNPRPDLRPHIVNNSWGGGGGSTFYQATVQAWRNAGIFPAFSIGNGGSSCGTAGSPGDYPESFGVGAIDIFDNIAGFSSRGPANGFGGIVKPNVSAPGVSVRSSVPTNSYANFSGTSMAAPHVAGVVALLWAAMPELVGDIAATEDILQRTAQFRGSTQCGSEGPPNNVYGWGIVDSLAAVQDSTATVTITATDPNAAEAGPDPGTFTVSRTGSTASSLTVFYSVGGSATNGTDYQSLSGSVTIPAGSSTAPITVNPIDDSLIEGDETVLVTLSSDAAYTVGSPSSATITITDSDSDTAPTSVQVTAPTSGQTSSGIFTLKGTAQDNSGTIQKIEFYIDSDTTPACSDTVSKPGGSTFQCNWDSATKPDGLRTVKAKAYDPSGNPAFSPSVPFTISNVPAGSADLVVTDLSAQPRTAAAGTSITVSDTTKNRETGTAGASKTKFYLSTNNTLGSGDVYLNCFRPIDALSPDGRSSGSTACTIPSGTAAGTYYVVGEADGDKAVAETNEGNNTNSSRSIAVGSGGGSTGSADLVVPNLSALGTARRGTTITVGDTTKNRGTGTAGQSKTKFYLSTNRTLDAAVDTLLCFRNVPSLAPEAKSLGSTPCTIPAGTAPGPYFIIAEADGDKAVGETNELNNINSKGIEIIQ